MEAKQAVVLETVNADSFETLIECVQRRSSIVKICADQDDILLTSLIGMSVPRISATSRIT